jgi:hypothetical protein
LIGLALSITAQPISPLIDAPPPGIEVTLSGLRQAGPDLEVLGSAAMESTRQWRTTIDPVVVGPLMTSSALGLSISAPAGYPRAVSVDPTAYLVTVPVPVPAIESGSVLRPHTSGTFAVSPFGFDALPMRPAGTVPVLPRLEESGVMVDLDYAQALAGPNTIGAICEVWLAAGTPASVVNALTGHGLVVSGQQSIASQAATYAREPAVAGLRFQVIAGFIGIALAAAALLLVSSVERRPRARELVALRHQGVSAAATRVIASLGYATLAAAAVLAGLLGAVLDRTLAGSGPLFRDRWHVLAPPPSLPASQFVILAVTAVLAFGFATLVAAHQLTAAIRAQTGEDA